jgi:hypothetical protein
MGESGSGCAVLPIRIGGWRDQTERELRGLVAQAPAAIVHSHHQTLAKKVHEGDIQGPSPCSVTRQANAARVLLKRFKAPVVAILQRAEDKFT